jgi:CheY-like chemotaxis protein/HPt (histidine-containing phosphotransfer) domain-containing protein
LLDIAKLEAGRIELEAIDFNLEELIGNTLDLLAPKAAEKNIDLGASVDPLTPRWLRGDPTRLRQVLTNLVGNAIKFTERGWVEVVIDVLEAGPGTVRLGVEVRDTGIGLSADSKRILFQKFTQGDASITRQYGGTGLGLVICKSLVELMGGEIGARSELGQGSTFWFTADLAPALVPVQGSPIEKTSLNGMRALVVDDIEMNRRLLRRLLEREGVVVTEADDAFGGFAALERSWHRGEPFDLVLLDQMMPGMSGIALAERVRQQEHLADTRIVLLSSMAPRAAGSRAGADASPLDAVLTKPIRSQLLIETLQRLFAPGIQDDVLDRPAGFDPAIPSAPPRVSAPGVSAAARILLVEDNKINQRVAVSMLTKAGLSADVAENGIEAVDAVERHDYDLILMDVQMPVLDGLEATRRIRALPTDRAKTPIIAMTAHAMNGDREKCLAVGMDDYLPKPIHPDTFIAIIHRWLHPCASRMQEKAQVGVEAPIFDDSRLSRFRAGVAAEDFDRLMSSWLHSLEERCSKIAIQTAAGDVQTLSREAHTLAGTAGTFGAVLLEQQALGLEEACRNEDWSAVPEISARLLETIGRTLAAFRAALSS